MPNSELEGSLPTSLSYSPEIDRPFEGIPVIDLNDAWTDDSSKRRDLANRIRNACVNVGFFYSTPESLLLPIRAGLIESEHLVKSHGIPDGLIQETVDAANMFFSLSEETKLQLDIHKSPNYKGYTALLGENTDSNGLGDLHEGFDLGYEPLECRAAESNPLPRDDGAMTGKNVWPGISGFRETTLQYYHRVLHVGKLLFPLFALALDLPENFFEDKTNKPAAIMRLLHYPPQSPTSFETDPNGRQIGIGAHTDYECFTILWQDNHGGLQVQNTAGKWVDAVPIPGTLVVNLGDQFARWTNDVFKSTLHRVINHSGAERYSIPLFFGTNYDVVLEPIPTCITPESPFKHEIMTAGEYVKSRLEATYSHSAAARIGAT